MRKLIVGNRSYVAKKIKGTKKQIRVFRSDEETYVGKYASVAEFRKKRAEKHAAGYGW